MSVDFVYGSPPSIQIDTKVANKQHEGGNIVEVVFTIIWIVLIAGWVTMWTRSTVYSPSELIHTNYAEVKKCGLNWCCQNNRYDFSIKFYLN